MKAETTSTSEHVENTAPAPAKKSRRKKRGRGSIYQRKDGRWCAEMPLAGGGRKFIYGATAGDVERKLTAAKSTLDGGGVLVVETLTVTNIVEAFLEAREQSTRAATVGSYRRLFKHHIKPHLGALRARSLTSDTLQAFVNKQTKAWPVSQAAIAEAIRLKRKPPAPVGWSPSLTHHVLAVLRMAFRLALRKRKVMIDPTMDVRGPKVERNIPEPLRRAETQKLLEHARGQALGALWLITASLGLRRGEVLGLRWQDVDLKTGELHVRHQLSDVTGELVPPKSKRALRSLRLSPVVVAALVKRRAAQAAEKLELGEAWSDRHGLIFTGIGGVAIDGGTISKMHKAMCKDAGVRHVRFHDMRHGAADMMVAAGVDAATLSKTLGHANVAFTMATYVHPDQARLDDASDRLAKVLALDG